MARTFITLMAGAFVGILLSPISLWLLLHGDQVSPVQVQKAHLSCARAPGTQETVLASHSRKVTTRKLVYTAVLASQDGARAGPIHRTWGKQLGKHFGLYAFSKPGLPVSSHMDGVPVNFVPTNRSASVPQNLQKLRLLQHLIEMTPLLDYEFVLLTGDDLFVHAGNLHRLLQSVSPTNAFYLGRAASSTHCLGGPGILLSQAALSGLKKKIGNCVKSLSSQIFLPYDLTGDEILGKCMQSSLGLHCAELDKEHTHRFYQHGDFGSGTLQRLRDVIENAVTIHPVMDPVMFYHIHQLTMEHNYKIKMDQASSAVFSAERVSDHLQSNSGVFGKKWWLWYSMAHTNPKIRYELNTWQYFNSSNLCLSYEHQPMVSLPLRLKSAINTALDIVAKRINTSDNRAVLPYTLVDGFLLVDEAWGFEYVLRMSNVNNRKPSDHHVAHVYFPLQGTGMTILRPVQNSLQTVVNLIVPVPRRHTLAAFLEFFETDFIKENQNVHLHLVFFEHDEPMTVKIKQILHIYPNARIICHELKGHVYSTSRAYNYVSTRLAKHELMVFFDMNFYFTAEFLQHCRMNAIQGKQAYSPILFAFYKPDLVKKYAPQKQQPTIITTNTGFFLRYNYQVLALYNSDFVAVGRLNKLKGSGTDDVRFVDKLLLSNIYLMRALEPYLRKNYKPRSCKGLKTSAKSACMNSMADSIGSKKVLGSLAANQNIF